MSEKAQHGPLYFELNTGAKIPSVGLGTWKAPPGVVGHAVIAAVKAGYRHIDCAYVYDNEKEVGAALKQLFSTGVVKRDEMFITSKIWCSDLAPDDVPKALSRSLELLQLDYVDLYLIHWPFRTRPETRGFVPEIMLPLCLPETWAAMEKLYESLGSPGSWVKGEILKEPALIEIAEKLNKSPAQVALRWGIQSGHSILPKSVNESRIKENLNLFDWCIPPELFSKFSNIHQQRLLRGTFAVHETSSPYKSLEELWDGEI